MKTGKVLLGFSIILSFLTMCGQTKDFKLVIKIPTKSRPQQFFRRLDLYYKKLSDLCNCRFLISCDIDDKSMNCVASIARLKSYKNLEFYFSHGKGKIEAYNRDIEKIKDWDIVLVASDDMVPRQQNYDKIIIDSMKKFFPDTDGVLNFHDGHLGAELNTYPIIGRRFYERFGYIYHPHYKSLQCDNELMEISRMLKKEFVSNTVLLEHDHPIFTKKKYDPLYAYNESFGPVDQQTYRARRGVNYNLNLKVGVPIRLSILIPTAKERKIFFQRTYTKILNQIKKNKLEEIMELIFDDKNVSLLQKYKDLLQSSHGEYVCFVEDKYDVHDDYVSLIYEKLKKFPDCIILQDFAKGKEVCAHRVVDVINYPIRRDLIIRFKPQVNFLEEYVQWIKQMMRSKLIEKEVNVV
ncbi:TPA: hypothetical protein DIC20_03895 [Candidatus Dependentiae bacterium]|nr:MAG: hypothetical protein US03_C0001G0166 [candidate division TM6 bacterium GW2011_GWF2_36_131]KKQ03698.1 MAG: hypothetical protein US13_C0001G0038 [candidate division TM6 bacterium GW2011_GWE2_36_25]KKQ20066.1 MAG: hypothetical protein US32_C0002G0071 [candidate division TM6 bacterium GW2011_GWA2_36_9]HBR70465.1 hypothetical protein [Candidatus Dependentiae bacterium]HCU00819.1 hypothetical protein [Candidatus Dependentiae bacterium]